MSSAALPRVSIQFCTQCKWLLRAAYYAQELLSTFSTALGEVALQPSTGGTFVVTIDHAAAAGDAAAISTVLWDRKVDGGFPETKELKRRVRDVIEPERNLGHVDKDYGKAKKPAAAAAAAAAAPTQSTEPSTESKSDATDKQACEDCEDCK
ncbi:hypothetical protein Golomagni_07233 [Golovinomyces magnicellulatus]|nr:hypothetical protein Golomagni_07233 [Golovinomyces magnicellulatus]